MEQSSQPILQLNQAHVPQWRPRTPTDQILGAGFPVVKSHVPTHEEQVIMWQGRYAALKDLETRPDRLSQLLLEAENKLEWLRSLEREG
jgi:hypothetical protein